MKPDLERLLSEQQDRLRGRRRDWIDDFADWRQRTDWSSVAIIFGPPALVLLVWWWSQ